MSDTKIKVTLHNGCELSEREYELYLSMQQPHIVWTERSNRLIMPGKISQKAFNEVKDMLTR